MKKVTIALLCIAIGVPAAKAQDGKRPVNTANMQASLNNSPQGKFSFSEETHDYGEVPEGPAAEYDFVFTNTGKNPIIIREAHGSCGCTVPKWPQTPILPGAQGSIHVSYSTNGRPGAIQKDVIITSDAEQSPMVLHIRGSVKAKATDATAAVTPAATK